MMSEPTQGSGLSVGDLVGGRYRIEEPLASGGMGVVYRATQEPLDRSVALKVMRRPSDPRLDEAHSQRFVREAAAMASLHHPNTAVVYDYGQEGDVLFLAMEFIDGLTLSQYIRQRALLTPSQALHVAKQVASSLRDAHKQGLVHRDLKPGNVMLLTRSGDPFFAKVLDFGLVKNTAATPEMQKLTRTGTIMGSPRYMAPEQIRGENVDHRADIYALGGLLCFMLSGQSPFSGDSEIEMMRAHLYTPVPRLSELSSTALVSPAFEDLIAKCLDKDPAQRFQSMDDVLSALGALGQEDSAARAPASLEPARASSPVNTDSQSSTSISALFTRALINPGRSKLAWAMRVIMAAALLGFGMGIVYFAVHRESSDENAANSSATPPSELPDEPAETPSEAGVPIVLEVSPPTALVERDGAAIGNGRQEFTLPSGQVWEFQISAPGYVSASIRVDGTQSHVPVELTRSPRREPRGPAHNVPSVFDTNALSGPSGDGTSGTEGEPEAGTNDPGAGMRQYRPQIVQDPMLY